jgi:signal peptidase I
MSKIITDQPINSSKETQYWDQHNPKDYVSSETIFDKFISLKPSTKIITLRLPEHLLTNLKLIANKRDIPYQSLLKVFLQEKVNEELQTPFLKLKRKSVRKTLAGIAVVLITGVFTYSNLVNPIRAVGSSMGPNYPTNTYYLLDKVSYKLEQPKRGDVVVFHSPNQPNTQYFKRIIGLPGEKVNIINGYVYINGEKLYEPYSMGSTESKSYPALDLSIIVPDNSFYVLGDNRTESTDSRDFGFVTKEDILGKVSICYWNCN